MTASLVINYQFQGFLKLEFYNLKMAGSNNFTEHLVTMYSLTTEVFGLKYELHDEDKMAVLLHSIQEVSHFESTLEALCVASTTFKFMIALLLGRITIIRTRTPMDFVFASSSTQWKTNNNIQCRFCKQFGHKEAFLLQEGARAKGTCC